MLSDTYHHVWLQDHPVSRAGTDISKAGSRTSVANSSKRSTSPTSPSKMSQTSTTLALTLLPLDSKAKNISPVSFFLELPINKVQVGFAPSPNLKAAKSKIGSLANASHKPGGGNVKIESRKLHIEAKPRIGARNGNAADTQRGYVNNERQFFPLLSFPHISLNRALPAIRRRREGI